MNHHQAYDVRPIDQASLPQGLVLRKSRRKTEAETRLHVRKCFGLKGIPLKKGLFKLLVINLAPQRRLKAWSDDPLRLKDAGLSTQDMNAGFPASMSDGRDRLPPKSRHTPPAPIITVDRSVSQPSYAQRLCIITFLSSVLCLTHSYI